MFEALSQTNWQRWAYAAGNAIQINKLHTTRELIINHMASKEWYEINNF